MSNTIAFESQNFSPNPKIKQNNPYKVLFFIFFTLFLVTVSSVITVIFLKYKTPIAKPMPISIPTATPTTTANNVDTTDWVTYTNTTYKYSISHPKTWGSNPQSTYKNLTSFYIPSMDACHHSIFCYQNFDDLKTEYLNNTRKKLEYSSLSNYLNDLQNTDWKFVNKTNAGNQTFYKVISIDLASLPSYFVENNQNGSFCRIDLCKSNDSNTDEQFVFSFKYN